MQALQLLAMLMALASIALAVFAQWIAVPLVLLAVMVLLVKFTSKLGRHIKTRQEVASLAARLLAVTSLADDRSQAIVSELGIEVEPVGLYITKAMQHLAVLPPPTSTDRELQRWIAIARPFAGTLPVGIATYCEALLDR